MWKKKTRKVVERLHILRLCVFCFCCCAAVCVARCCCQQNLSSLHANTHLLAPGDVMGVFPMTIDIVNSLFFQRRFVAVLFLHNNTHHQTYRSGIGQRRILGPGGSISNQRGQPPTQLFQGVSNAFGCRNGPPLIGIFDRHGFRHTSTVVFDQSAIQSPASFQNEIAFLFANRSFVVYCCSATTRHCLQCLDDGMSWCLQQVVHHNGRSFFITR